MTPFKTLSAILGPLVSHFGFTRGYGVAGGERVPPAPLGWYFGPKIIKIWTPNFVGPKNFLDKIFFEKTIVYLCTQNFLINFFLDTTFFMKNNVLPYFLTYYFLISIFLTPNFFTYIFLDPTFFHPVLFLRGSKCKLPLNEKPNF